jgi:CRP-like cAMP-binding protein
MMQTQNRLLRLMNAADQVALADKCDLVNLAFRERLEEPNKKVPYIYFIETGLASLMYKGSGDDTAEVGLVGRDGCTGCGTILGVFSSPQGTSMQVAGSAQRISSLDLRQAIRESARLQEFLLRFVHRQIMQRDETALAASKGTVFQRLARWLLMAQDRLCSAELPLTHDLLSLMLSAHRPAVTVSLGHLRSEGLIETTRGHIIVRNRGGLIALAGGMYGAAGVIGLAEDGEVERASI